MVNISFPDGMKKKFEGSVTPLEIAKSISEGLARNALAAKVDKTLIDVTTPITTDATVEIITSKSKESLEMLRHTTAHVFAQALLRVFPQAKITIGPAVENGFYYDVDYDDTENTTYTNFSDQDIYSFMKMFRLSKTKRVKLSYIYVDREETIVEGLLS